MFICASLKTSRRESTKPNQENECLRPEYIVFVFLPNFAYIDAIVAHMVEVRRMNGFHVGPI